MSWLQANFEIATGNSDALSDALLAQGARAVELSDADAGTDAEQPVFDEPGSERQDWRRYLVRVLFDEDADARAVVTDALVALDMAVPEILIERVAEQDWVRATQQQFGPIEVSERLWIVPSWCEAPDPSALNLTLDPGLAFGTGSHPTTRQCLRWLDENVRPGQSVLDYGCGSGVLGIAAKRLGAGEVVGVDIDPAALDAARANALANRVELRVVDPDNVPAGPYDIVVANILSSPLKMLAPLLAGLLGPGGRITLAGILSAQAEDVAEAYTPWFEMHIFSEQEGWACLTGVRSR